jgi:hypothetical protein
MFICIYAYHESPVDIDPDSCPDMDTDSDPDKDTGMRLMIERNTEAAGTTDAINRLTIPEVIVTKFLMVSESGSGGLQPG